MSTVTVSTATVSTATVNDDDVNTTVNDAVNNDAASNLAASNLAMSKMLRRARELVRDERGSVLTEYIAVLVFIAIVSLAVWSSYRSSVKDDVNTNYQTFGYTGT